MNQIVKRSQVDQLYKDGKLTYYFAFLVFGFYTLITYDLINTESLITWCLWFNLAIVLRGISLLKFRQSKVEAASAKYWLWTHVFISFMFGTAQAWLITMFDISWPIHTQIGFWTMIIGIVAITIRPFTAVYMSYLAFNGPILISSLITLLIVATPDYQLLIWMLALYAMGVNISALNAYRNNTLQIQNEISLLDANKKLSVLASRDPLTNLPNRRAFDEYYMSEWDRHKRSASVLSLLVIDLDFFKQYNDTYGHTAGDDCLIRIANRINECLKRPADKAARFGGEEFLVLLPDTPTQGALEVAERILASVRQLAIPHKKSTTSDIITVSIGLATIDPSEDAEPDELFELADTELYKAKSGGRNRLSRYSPETEKNISFDFEHQ